MLSRKFGWQPHPGRAASAMLAAILISGCLTIQASALTYHGFDDIPPDAWYAASVNLANDAGWLPYGLDAHYGPMEAATSAEFAYALFHAEGIWVRSAHFGEFWSAPYLEAVSQLVGEDIEEDPLTRAAAARILCSVLDLPLEGTGAESPFTDTDDLYAAAAYRAGLMSGAGEEGERLFSGAAPLSRAEMAAICARLPSSDARDREPVPIGCIDPNTPLPSNPRTAGDFRQLFEYMMVHDLDRVEVAYSEALTEEEQADVKETLQAALKQFRFERSEYYSYFQKAAIRSFSSFSSSFRLEFIIETPGHDTAALMDQRRESFAAARDILEDLYATGALNTGMTEKERARVLTEWVSSNTKYELTGDWLDHTAWSVLKQQSGVCDGFASSLQLLLSLDNIQCWGQYGHVKAKNEAHQWTMAILDGELLGIDPTFYRVYKSSAFGMTPDVIDARYSTA